MLLRIVIIYCVLFKFFTELTFSGFHNNHSFSDDLIISELGFIIFKLSYLYSIINTVIHRITSLIDAIYRVNDTYPKDPSNSLIVPIILQLIFFSITHFYYISIFYEKKYLLVNSLFKLYNLIWKCFIQNYKPIY